MWVYPKIIAHRGGGSLAPENTLAALRCGLAYGFHAVEFDVMALDNGDCVLMHDSLCGRTVQAEGTVTRFSAAQLANMDAGSWFSPAFAGEPVPEFAAAIAFCLEHGIWMNAEIKPAPGKEAETGRLVAQMCASLPTGAVLLSSFSVTALQSAMEVAPEVPRALLVEQVPPDWLQQLQLLDAHALHVKAAHLTQAQAQAIKKAGIGLFCYTVNDPKEAQRLLAMGVDAFCTDRIDIIPSDFAIQSS
jgi:glycerophosphoryl diester phosphodiesterase